MSIKAKINGMVRFVKELDYNLYCVVDNSLELEGIRENEK